jgi:hypothetical protein
MYRMRKRIGMLFLTFEIENQVPVVAEFNLNFVGSLLGQNVDTRNERDGKQIIFSLRLFFLFHLITDSVAIQLKSHEIQHKFLRK